MTEPERTERPYRGPLPGEVPLSRASQPGGATPGLIFDDVTGRVIRAEEEPERQPAPSSREPDPAPSSPEPDPAPSSPEPEPAAARPTHVPDRAPTRAQRRTDGRAMIPLLAQALSTQLAQLAAADDRAPDGWWFTPED